MCAICYWVATTTAYCISMQNGISTNGVGENCGPGPVTTTGALDGADDFLIIPEGVCAPPEAIAVSVDKYCGSATFDCASTVAIANAIAPINTVCTNAKPFKVTFYSDGTEAIWPATGEGQVATNSEGFQL